MAERARLLILGGTGEAAALATHLAARPDLDVITSLAGRTRAPAHPPGLRRTGGFGGAPGLARYLGEESIDLVVDATHPFAAGITANAATACAQTGVPRLILARPPWAPQAGDRWIEAADAAGAAAALPGLARRVFLSTGRRELGAFSGLSDLWFLVRLIDRPPAPVPLRDYELVLARGPFTVEDEKELLKKHAIAAVVSKNSGGEATYAKVAAARALALPVVIIRRPALPDGEAVTTVDAALAWVEARCPAPARA